jgi:hypothetical protein
MKIINIAIILLLAIIFQNTNAEIQFEDNTINVIMTPEYSRFNITWVNDVPQTYNRIGQWCVVTPRTKECFISNKTAYYPLGSAYNMKFKITYTCDFDNGYNQMYNYQMYNRYWNHINMTLYQSKNFTITQRFINSPFTNGNNVFNTVYLPRYKYIIDDAQNIFEFDVNIGGFTQLYILFSNITVISPVTCPHIITTLTTTPVTTESISTTTTTSTTTQPRTHIIAPQQIKPCMKTKNEHTETYYNWKEGIFTNNFFLPNTFITNIIDPNDLTTICKPYTRTKYVNFLRNNNIDCSGSWCIDDEFSCLVDGKLVLDCYQGEHIIDRRDSIPEFAEDDKNIFGNIVMAYGWWNNQIGRLSWDRTEAEKREIYGELIVDKAIENIRKCKIYNSDKRIITRDIENNEDTSYDDDADCNIVIDNDNGKYKQMSIFNMIILNVLSSMITTLISLLIVFIIWKVFNGKKRSKVDVLLGGDTFDLDRDNL